MAETSFVGGGFFWIFVIVIIFFAFGGFAILQK